MGYIYIYIHIIYSIANNHMGVLNWGFRDVSPAVLYRGALVTSFTETHNFC